MPETTAELTTTTMTALLSTITEVFTAAIGWVGTVAETVASTPLFLVGIVLTFITVGISLFRSLLSN